MNVRRGPVDMCSGPVTSGLLRYALPVVLSGFLSLSFNAADAIVVGKFAGDTALAAVTSSAPLLNLMIPMFSGLSMGTNVVVARALGRGEQEEVEQAVHTSVLVGLICGLFLSAVGLIFAPLLLRWMSCPPSVMVHSVVYLRIYFLGVPAALVSDFSAAVLRGSGDTRRPLNFQMIAGSANVVLNLILVIVFHMGVAGVAVATVASQYIWAFLVLRCLRHEMGPQRLDLHRLRIEPEVLGRMIRIGVPASLQGIVVGLSNTVIQSSVNSFGEVVMAGSGAAYNLECYVWMGMNTFYSACLTFVSANLGAGNRKRVDQVVVRCVLMGFATGAVLGGLARLFGPQLLSLFISSPDAIAQGMVRVSLISAPYCLYSVLDVLTGALRGMGASMGPMLISVIGMCGLRLAWIALILPLNRTPAMLYLSYSVSWVVTDVAMIACFLFVRRRVFARHERRDSVEGGASR